MGKKLIYGVGINDIGPCPYERTWRDMLKRCYSEACLQKQPTYRGCKVCNEWLTFSNFKSWMETQNWEGQHLDKDFLGNGKLYSPETCCFVPQWLNNLFTCSNAKRGEYPLGVTRRRKKFAATVSVNNKSQNLGYFDTPEEAHAAYKKAKAEYVQGKMKDYPDQRVREAVLNKVTAAIS